MAQDDRVSACLKDWRPHEMIDTDCAHSATSPPFKSPSQPDINWKLIVKGAKGSAYKCNVGKGAGTCLECLELSLELEGGGEPEELEPVLCVTVRGKGNEGEPVSASGAFRAFPAHLHIPASYKLIRGPLVCASVVCASYKLVSSTFTNEALLADPKFSDFEIRVGEGRIPIHRNIFSRFSEVFARMFERDMEEKSQGFVLINDFSVETMLGLRAFLYAGRAEAVRQEPWTFLDCGEKYGIRELKDYCVKLLRQQLSVDNLCEWAALADKYRLDGLFGECSELLKRPDWTFSVSKERWDALVKDHRDVADRLISHSVTFA